MSAIHIDSLYPDGTKDSYTIEGYGVSREVLWDKYIRHDGYHGKIVDLRDHEMTRIRYIHSMDASIMVTEVLTFLDSTDTI